MKSNINRKKGVIKDINGWKDIFVYNNGNWVYEMNGQNFIVSYNKTPGLKKNEPEETAIVLHDEVNPLRSIYFILYGDLRQDVANCKGDIGAILELFLNNKDHKMSIYSHSKKEFNDFLKNNTSLLVKKENKSKDKK